MALASYCVCPRSRSHLQPPRRYARRPSAPRRLPLCSCVPTLPTTPTAPTPPPRSAASRRRRRASAARASQRASVTLLGTASPNRPAGQDLFHDLPQSSRQQRAFHLSRPRRRTSPCCLQPTAGHLPPQALASSAPSRPPLERRSAPFNLSTGGPAQPARSPQPGPSRRHSSLPRLWTGTALASTCLGRAPSRPPSHHHIHFHLHLLHHHHHHPNSFLRTRTPPSPAAPALPSNPRLGPHAPSPNGRLN
ncbi:hypothetical protein EJ04DRAFT_337040 [Polyplosphaeria fusca]|uniref:Uncharacterized protein n=1 Tax=Polyplosphaeria fusca TaxID=682080 RepID=A0A9P4QRG6_9PLEO|nr:hypothetical protein EJ04DRAFT_337040 [Polyplosphaeria fusca]